MKNNRFVPVCIIVVAIIFVMLGVKVVIHEKWQSNQIHVMANQISELQEDNNADKERIDELQDQIDKLNGKVEYSDTAFNYLAIGNSITKHGIADYWWNEIGMAATSADKDYVHIVAKYIDETKGGVCWYAMNFAKWERQAHDRAETFEDIDKYLNKKLNLVTIQLSENVSDTTTFEEDYEELIRYIQKNAPNANVIVIGDFWSNEDKECLKKEAAEKLGVCFISLDEIKGNKEYQCGIGTTVYDADGNTHVVEHEGVAAHPGDSGMQYIADKIIEAMNMEIQ